MWSWHDWSTTKKSTDDKLGERMFAAHGSSTWCWATSWNELDSTRRAHKVGGVLQQLTSWESFGTHTWRKCEAARDHACNTHVLGCTLPWCTRVWETPEASYKVGPHAGTKVDLGCWSGACGVDEAVQWRLSFSLAPADGCFCDLNVVSSTAQLYDSLGMTFVLLLNM